MIAICRVLLAAFAFGPLGAATAQAPTADDARERHALELKARGDYATAAAELLGLAASTAGDAAGGAHAAARVEFHAVVAHLLARRTGDVTARSRLAELAESALATRHPTLRARLLQLVLDLDRSAGDAAAQLDGARALGHLGRFWLLGPLDNERGAGFARAFGPETGFDVDAEFDGKARPVRWRPAPIPEPVDGYFDLDAIVRPNDQVLCYAAVALLTDSARDIALHLGSDESFVVFLNGVRVGARDVRRAFASDQDAFRLPLRAGANLLLLKICDQEGAFGFAARITEPDGSPVVGVTIGDERDDLREAARPLADDEPRAIPDAEPPFRGALSVFERGADDGRPRDAFRLAMLLALAQPDDPSARRDHALALRAARELPDDAAVAYLLAFTRVQAGNAEEKDENARRHDYERILALEPEHAEALRSLAELEIEGTGLHGSAQGHLRRALEIRPDFAAARLLLAETLRAQRLELLADAELERAAAPDARGHRSPDATRAWFDLLVAQGRLAEAAALAPVLARTASSPGVLVDIARLHARRGDANAARETLELSRRIHPFAREPRLRLAKLLESQGDLAGSGAELRAWLEICPDDDDVLVELAGLSARQGQSDRQRELLRTALELNPNRKTERRYLEYLESGEKPFYDPWVIDTVAVLAADAGPPEAAIAAHDAYHWTLRQDVVRAWRNGTTSRYRHEIVRILTEDGARRMTDWSVPHFWGEQRARLIEVRIDRSDGSVQRPRLRGSSVRLALQPGDRVTIRSRVDDLAPGWFGDYFGLEHRFTPADGSAIARAELVVSLEPGRSHRFQSSNGAPEPAITTAADGSTVLHYALAHLGRGISEERRPSWHETEPLVRVTTYASWDEFASWWWNLIRNQTEVSPAMREKVDELTLGLTDDRDKIAAIYRFVTTDIRYKAWEFGVHGFKPYRTSVIFDRRHGDCKDKALLLNAMLGLVGIDAHPVLIRADVLRSADDLSLPMVEHFNHCISFVPGRGDRGDLYLDGTATYHPIDTLPEMDSGAAVLVVDRGKGLVRNIDWTAAADTRLVRECEVSLASNGDAEITLRLRPRRNQAVWVRELLGNEPGRRRENVERLLAAEFGNVEVHAIECSDLLDTTQPVAVDVRFTARGLASGKGGALSIEPPFTERPWQSLTSATARSLPLLLGCPSSEQDTVRYLLPDGFAPVAVPPPVVMEDHLASYRIEWRFERGQLVVERERALRVPRIEPAEYPRFRELADRADTADRSVVLVRGRRP